MISEKMKSEWINQGWTFEETNEGFCFHIKFPFMNLERNITIYFETEKEINYYYIKTILSNGTTNIEETLFVEMKEHNLIHNTLIDLGWIEKKVEDNTDNKELTIFDFV